MLEWRVSPEGPAAEGELPGVVVVGDEVQVDQHQEEDRGRGHEEEEQQPQGDRLYQGSVSMYFTLCFDNLKWRRFFPPSPSIWTSVAIPWKL